MGNANNLQATLARLAKMNSTNTKTTTGSVKFYKAKPGKNNIIVLPTPQTGDPFLEWGTHKNLLDVSYKDIACNKHNKGEECLICQVVDDLKKQDWKGNFDVWKPLELKIRYFSPVIDLDDLEAGVKWWGYGKSVLGQFENWLLNLEEDEKPFYDTENPEKIIVNYNPDGAPTEMYKLDKKSTKTLGKEQNEAWAETVKPLNEVMTYEMPQEKVVKALEEYMDKVKATVASATVPTEDEDEKPAKVNKLDALKKK
jgi:hypothetical protein